MKINIDDKVMIANPEGALARFDGKTGTVERIYPEVIPPIAIVKFEDDETVAFSMSVKVPVENLIKVEIEVKIEIPEGAKQITKAEFMDAITQVTKPDKIVEKVGEDKGMLVGIACLVSGIKLAEKLFKETEVIVITKDQLLHEIAASATDEDPKFMIVALMNSLILRGIVDVFFSDVSDND